MFVDDKSFMFTETEHHLSAAVTLQQKDATVLPRLTTGAGLQSVSTSLLLTLSELQSPDFPLWCFSLQLFQMWDLSISAASLQHWGSLKDDRKCHKCSQEADGKDIKDKSDQFWEIKVKSGWPAGGFGAASLWVWSCCCCCWRSCWKTCWSAGSCRIRSDMSGCKMRIKFHKTSKNCFRKEKEKKKDFKQPCVKTTKKMLCISVWWVRLWNNQNKSIKIDKNVTQI